MEFGILGPLVLWNDGSEVPIGAPKQRALLALLLLRRGELVPTEVLVEDLWPDRTAPATAVKAVQVYVSQLRKVLRKGVLETHPAGYALHLEADALDAARFEGLLERGRRLLADGEALRAKEVVVEALALWRGPALAEFRYEDFARDEIARLDGLRLVAFETRLEAELALGRHAEAIPEIEALVREYPLRETLRRLLMLALYRAGRQADALAAYQDARTALVEELGIEPGESIRQLEAAILRHDSALDLADQAEHAVRAEPSTPVRVQPAEATRSRGRLRWSLVSGALAVAALAGVLVFVLGGSGSALAQIDANSVGAIDTGNNRIVKQVTVGSGPGRVASGGGSIWVANVLDDSVSRVDPKASSVQDVIPVDLEPTALAFGQGSLWVACSGTRKLLWINPETDKILKYIPVGNGPTGVALSPGAVWVTNRFDDTVTEIDSTTGRVEHTFDAGPNPSDITYGLGALWITNQSSSTVTRLDPRTGGAQTVAVGNGPDAVAVGAGAVWVANSLDATVSKIDPSSDVVTSAIPVGPGPSSVLAEQGAVWVADRYAGEISLIDVEKNRVVTTIAVGNGPQSLAVADGHLWVTARGAAPDHRGGTLRADVPADLIGGLDAALADSPQPYAIVSMVGDGLVGVKRVSGDEGGTLVPDLATSLPVPTDGGRTYTFQLRPDIRYSNGVPVRASDERGALERAFLLGSPSASYYGGLVGAGACSKRHCDLSRGVIADDKAGSVTMHLRAPDPEFPYKLTVPAAWHVPPVPMKPVGRLGVPGTGPYVIASHGPKRIVLVRNPYFQEWSAAAQPDGYPDRIVWNLAGTPGQQLTAVEHGKADYVRLEALRWRDELATRYSAQVHIFPTPSAYALFLNTRVAPFDNPAARQAVNYAIDRRKAAAAFGPEGAVVTCQIIPVGSPGYAPQCLYTQRPGSVWSAPDLALARKLVASSGTRGEKVVVWTIKHPFPTAIGKLVVRTLDELGYRASLKFIRSVGPFFAAIYDRRNRAQIGFVGWGSDYPAASQFLSMFTCQDAASANVSASQLCDHGLDRAISSALNAQSTDSPGTSWAEVDRRVMGLAPWVPLVNSRAVVVVSRRVGNVQFNPEWGTLIDQLWVK